MRRTGLYSLIVIASLALISLTAAGVVNALNQGEDRPVEQADTPTVSEPPEPMPETEPEEESEKKAEREEEPEEKAEREARERKAAEQAAAEEEAREREAAEQAAAEEEAAPVQKAAPSSNALSLSVPGIGIQNDPVTDSVSEGVLSNGAGKLPQTGFPWQQGANTYIAAHVYGYPGTGSWQQFADLPSLQQGEEIFLTDSGGTTYEYRVSEIVTVAPTDVWVAESTGENMVSLQTCVGPGWSERLVVRGEMVGSSQA